MRKVFLDELPKWESGNYAKEGSINWKKAINCTVLFVYDDISDELKILDYDTKSRKLSIKYKNEEVFKINAGNFTKCKLGNYLKKYTSEFKIEIGMIFKDDKRDIVIIHREFKKDKTNKSWKWYKYKCSKCNYEGWVVENSLLDGTGCSCCCRYNSIPTLGFNTIWDTDRWMCDLGVSEEDAKSHTSASGDRIRVTCPYCGRVKNKTVIIGNIYKRRSISCDCSDKIPYSEKIMYSVLEQLKIKFINQLTKNNFKWCMNFKYDFYVPSIDCIIETNGIQHYEESSRGRSLEEEQLNDKIKQEISEDNGIKNYIIIDCRESKLEFIKNNILNSKLAGLLDLSNIDWNKVEEFALSNLVLKVCQIKKENPNITTTEIGKIIGLSNTTIRSYLKRGSRIWDWVNYDAQEEIDKSLAKGREIIVCGKKVEVFKDNTSLGVFGSCGELERKSEMLFGVKLDSKHISDVSTGKRKTHKGFTFKYI